MSWRGSLSRARSPRTAGGPCTRRSSTHSPTGEISHGSPTTPRRRETSRRCSGTPPRRARRRRRRARIAKRRCSTRVRCGMPSACRAAERADLLDRYAEEAHADRPIRGGGRGAARRRSSSTARSATACARAMTLVATDERRSPGSVETRRPRRRAAQAIELLESLPPGPELAMAYAVQAYARMLSRDNARGRRLGAEGRSRPPRRSAIARSRPTG